MSTDSEVNGNFKIESYDWNSPLVGACRDFVKFKDDMDMANRTSYMNPAFIRKLRWLTGLYEPAESGRKYRRSATASLPAEFAHFALPFLCTLSSEVQDYEKCLIHPNLVISGTYNTYNRGIEGGFQNISPERVMDWSDKCVMDKDTVSDQQYYQPQGIPLYVALEGKNRVELFKRHRSRMLAWVTPKTTVPFEMLQIIRLKPFNIWAIRHGSKICILPFSRYALPVYRALGVIEGPPRWDFFALKKLRCSRINACRLQMAR